MAAPVWSQQAPATEPAPVDSTQRDQLDRGLGRTILSGAAAVADPLLATEGTVDAVKWMAKRRQVTIKGTPYGITGLPVVYYSPGSGWNYGTRVQISDYSRRPYRYKLTVHSVRSSEGKRNTYVRLKVPHLSGTGFGLSLMASNRRDLRARYYGRGNDSEFDEKKDEDYYRYVLKKPRLSVSLLRHLYGPVTMSFDLGLERSDVDPATRNVASDDEGSGERPYDSFYQEQGTVIDGVTGYVGVTLVWDTRDDPTIPRRGVFHEWSYETSRNSLLSLLFEEIDYQRHTFTDARYWPRSERLNIAHRTVVEALRGSVPLYAYGEIGGSRRLKGLGGSDTLRGFDRQRFTDNVRVFTNTEARYQLGSTVAFKQHLELHGVLFVDTGQVQPGFNELRVRNIHITAGWGVRIYWNADFVLRSDFGISPEQTYTTVKLSNLF